MYEYLGNLPVSYVSEVLHGNFDIAVVVADGRVAEVISDEEVIENAI